MVWQIGGRIGVVRGALLTAGHDSDFTINDKTA